MSHHIFRDGHVVIYLSIVYLELESYEIWQYCRGACLGLDGWCSLAGLWTNDGKAVVEDVQQNTAINDIDFVLWGERWIVFEELTVRCSALQIWLALRSRYDIRSRTLPH